MNQKSTVTEHYMTASRIHLEDVLDLVDDLHNAASEGQAVLFAEMTEQDVINYLRDLIYTAQETIDEIQKMRAERHKLLQAQPALRIIEKS